MCKRVLVVLVMMVVVEMGPGVFTVHASGVVHVDDSDKLVCCEH